MSIFKTLAETLSDRRYFDIEEVESIIETYFKLYLSDIKTKDIILDEELKERSRIYNEREQLSLRRDIIEKQLFDAKDKIRNKEEVDRAWMSKANFALRATKRALTNCQDQLSILNLSQKKRSITASQEREPLVIKEVVKILGDRFGKEYARLLFKEAGDNVDNNLKLKISNEN